MLRAAGISGTLVGSDTPSDQEAELITKFLPMLMSFVVDDYTFNVDQKLPAEEKAPVTYPNTLPESFTK